MPVMSSSMEEVAACWITYDTSLFMAEEVLFYVTVIFEERNFSLEQAATSITFQKTRALESIFLRTE